MCSLSWDYGIVDNLKFNHLQLSCFAWGKEGYHLWMVAKNSGEEDEVYQMSMAKSPLVSNPSSMSSCGEIVSLIAEDRLYLGVGASLNQQDKENNSSDSEQYSSAEPLTPTKTSQLSREGQPIGIGNHQWIVIQMPTSYLYENWPIRYAAIDDMGHHIGIAGRTGVAHYSLVTRKWKLFGNETQEKDIEVCGSLLWWNAYIVFSCFNVLESRYEIRTYPQRSKLDNKHMSMIKVKTEVLLISVLENRLLALFLDGSLTIIQLNEDPNAPSDTTASVHLHMSTLNDINISNLIVPAECVTSIILSNLHIENQPQSKTLENDSILMNICGRLFLLEEDLSNSKNTAIYKAVSILASGVENVWVSQYHSSEDRPHLTNALWLSCGCNGMGVWLPLIPSEAEKSFPLSRAHNFMSKRIMLPINTHIYPLGMIYRN